MARYHQFALTVVAMCLIGHAAVATAAAAGMTCDITDYGAVAGGPDCSASLQSAFAACATTGSTVVVPAGRFSFGDMEIKHINGTRLLLMGTLVALGSDDVTLELKHVNDMVIMSEGSGGFEGNGAAWHANPDNKDANPPQLLQIDDAVNVLVGNMHFEDAAGTALYLKGVNSSYAKNVSTSSSGTYPGVSGVVLHSVHDVSVSGSSLAGVTQACINVTGLSSAVVVDGISCFGAPLGVGPPDAYPVIDGGGPIRDVSFSNCFIANSRAAIEVRTNAMYSSNARRLRGATSTVGVDALDSSDGVGVFSVSFDTISLGGTGIADALVVSQGTAAPRSGMVPVPISGVTVTGMTASNSVAVSSAGRVECAGTATPCQVNLNFCTMGGTSTTPLTCDNASVRSNGVSPAVPSSCQ